MGDGVKAWLSLSGGVEGGRLSKSASPTSLAAFTDRYRRIAPTEPQHKEHAAEYLRASRHDLHERHRPSQPRLPSGRTGRQA